MQRLVVSSKEMMLPALSKSAQPYWWSHLFRGPEGREIKTEHERSLPISA